MPAFDFNLNKAGLALHAASGSAKVASAAPDAKSGDSLLDGAFQNLLDIVNPLQHLPVVGTLYRAITHDTIGTVEKIAGDALYGGLWGAVGAVADSAFKAATGKDFGATMLAMVTGGDDDKTAATQLAAAAPAKPVKNAATTAPASAAPGADVTALATSLTAKGIDNALSARALFAYRQSQGLVNPAANSLVAAN